MYQNILARSSRSILATFSVIIAFALVGSSLVAPSSALALGPDGGSVTITSSATGALNVSIDTTSADGGTNTPVDLDGPALAETSAGSIAVGTHTLTLPTGWKFFPGSAITIGKTGTGLLLGSPTIASDSHSFSFSVTHISTSPGTVMFFGLRVVPEGTSVGSGEITYSGAGMGGISGSWGTLSTIPSTVAKIVFVTQPGVTATEYGSNLSTQPVVKTQDRFGNDSSNGAADKTVTLELTPESTGTLSGTNPVSISSGTASFSGLKIGGVDAFGTKYLTATATGLEPITSSQFVITKKTLTATITATSKTYDGNGSATFTDPIPSVSDDGLSLSSDPLTSATFADVNAGPGIMATATGLILNGANKDNYSYDGTATGRADITPLAITITPTTGQTKVYGNADPVLTYTPDNSALIAGNSFSGALSRASGDNFGDYEINLGTLSAGGNYLVTLDATPVNFSITKRPITVTASANTKPYDGNTTASAIPTITGSLADGDTNGFIETYSNEDVGSPRRLTPSGIVNDGNGGNNYSYTGLDSWSMNGAITAKELTVTGLSATDKSYDSNTSADITGTPVLVGVVGSEDVHLTGTAIGTFDTKDVGSNKTVTVSELSLIGDDIGNYTLTQPTLNATISTKEITITPNASQTTRSTAPLIRSTHTLPPLL